MASVACLLKDCSATSRGTVTPRARADDIPSSIDWRQKGVITPVKFQVRVCSERKGGGRENTGGRAGG